MLKSAPVPTENINSHDIKIASTGMATIYGGYAIIYANSTNETTTTNDSFTILGKVYANFISYNRTDEDRTILLYTVNNNVNFTGIYCDLVSIGVGQVCIIATNFINFNSNDTANNITKKYIRVNFVSSGSLLKVDEPSNLPNLAVRSKGWLATSMSYGGYILYANDGTNFKFYYVYAYDEHNNPTPLVSTISSNQTVPINNFTTNTYGAYHFMKSNNVLIFPTLDTNAQKTSWSLYSILLPKVLESRDHGFGNLEINQIFPSINGKVDSSYTTINITFYDPVMLSNDPQHGYLIIYKTSDTNVFRQKIPPTSDYCQISLDGKTININVLTSTFNEYNQSYYVRMDNNFVKSRIYQEPLKGINDRIWNLISDNKNNLNTNSSGYAIVGLASITNDAKSKFLSFSRSERSYYFAQLLNEIAEKVPIRSERLSTDDKFQYINYGKPDEQIIFSINVNLPNSNESTVDSMVSDINTMIFYKRITPFSTGLTNGLDESYGFIILNDFWVDNKELNIISIMILAIIIILYSLLKDILKRFNVNFNDIEIFHTCLGYAIIAINSFFTAYFVFINSQDKPELFLPR
ncbi:hypothetical protein F8M41_025973 [Gigaspora margarita]|uniref:Uncharacterized protein n=1 Tax=Gigaspora margarita TaxID=4874 RepID=A0A8H3XKU6_GIGMA|nr:hypothetical protein F8M41_025973 [Gigaspora margarita]